MIHNLWFTMAPSFIVAMISFPKNITRLNRGLVTLVLDLTNDGMLSLIVTGFDNLSRLASLKSWLSC